MGDNRDDRLDSRYWRFVQQNIIGRPMFISGSFPMRRKEDLPTPGERLAFTAPEVITLSIKCAGGACCA